MTTNPFFGQDRPNRGANRLLPHRDSDPVQIVIPSTGKKLLGFLLDESADGAAVQLRPTRCLATGDHVQFAKNGRTIEAVVKHATTYGICARIGLEWVEKRVGQDSAEIAELARLSHQ